MRARATILAASVAALAAALAATPAHALAPCAGAAVTTRTLLSGQGTLESAIVDRKGRLFFTNGTQLLRLDAPGGQPKVMVDGVDHPGGLVLDDQGKLIMGVGDSIQNGTSGDTTGPASLMHVDPDTGAHSPYATGLSMANGVARAADGTIYATNDIGASVDRIAPGGKTTQRSWATVRSGNGIVVGGSGQYLYVVQTFQPAAVQRIDIAHPDQVTPYFAASDSGDLSAGLDGMTRDANDTLYIAANGAGAIWRVDPGPPVKACQLLGGLPGFPSGPSMVVPGNPIGPFPPNNLYVVTFGGDVIELRNAVPLTSALPGPYAPPAKVLHVVASPSSARAGQRTRFSFTVSAPGRPTIAGVTVRFAGHRAKTGRTGRATITATPRRAGRLKARATLEGFRAASATVRVR